MTAASTPGVLNVVAGSRHDERTWVIRCHVDDSREVECWLRDALGSGRVLSVVDIGADNPNGRVAARATTAADDPGVQRRLDRLSRAERKVLDLLADGLTNRQIADDLHLAHKTVKNYVSSLLCKLDMNRRTEAAVFAARLRDQPPGGLVAPVRGRITRNAS